MIKQIKKDISRAEIFLPFTDYNKIEPKKENTIKSIVFIIVSLILEAIIYFYYYKVLNKNEFNSFIEQYIETEINIVILLLSFSIAYLTILISSEGENIKILKNRHSNIDEFSLYQILLIQLTYCIYSEIVLLVILLINKFILPIDIIVLKVTFFIVCVVVLLNIIYITFKNVKNIYLSFWK